jgi:hypothetical protein
MRLLLLLLPILAACSSPEPAPPPEATPTPLTAKEAWLQSMHGRMEALDRMESALIRNDLPAARLAAVETESAPWTQRVPGLWQERVQSLSGELGRVAGGESLSAMSLATARSVGVCGECHDQAGAKIEFEPAPHPGRKEGSKQHMQRHATSADLMREAIIANDSARWASAMTWLAQGPLEEAELGGTAKLDEKARGLEAVVHGLAARGQTLEEPDERVALYALVIEACATCHKHMTELAAAPDEAPSEEPSPAEPPAE